MSPPYSKFGPERDVKEPSTPPHASSRIHHTQSTRKGPPASAKWVSYQPTRIAHLGVAADAIWQDDHRIYVDYVESRVYFPSFAAFVLVEVTDVTAFVFILLRFYSIWVQEAPIFSSL